MTVTIDKALAAKDDQVKITVTTDEKLKIGGLNVSINGPAGAANTGVITMTSPTPNVSEGTFTVAAGTLTGKYGVSIQMADLGNNSVDNLTAVSNETVAAPDITVSGGTSVIKVANGPIADADFDGDVDKFDVSGLSFSINAATTNAITVVDASARTITVNVAVGAAETATVSYSYVKDDTFQVDQTAPTVTFDPPSGSSVVKDPPVLTIAFDDDEYAGDSFKTVTVTKAELTKPDGSVVDIIPSLTTSDNISYAFDSSNLSLNVYTLKLTGKDVAGNVIAEVKTSFHLTSGGLTGLIPTAIPGLTLWTLAGLAGAFGVLVAWRLRRRWA